MSGAKAATLARGRSLGLPVLQGVVVPSGAATAALHAGIKALADTGSGGARLAVMAQDVDPELVAEVRAAVERLGAPVVVRSSSRVEDSGEFAGAFSSFDGVGPDDVRTALRGVWASPFSVDALERCEAAGVPVEDLALAVLVQPEITPLFAGSAKVRSDATVELVAGRGAPARLMSGWDSGSAGLATPEGQRTGEALELLGDDVFDAVAELAREVLRTLGDDLIEWAWTDDGVVLLQARRAAEPPPPIEPPPPLPVYAEPAALAISATVRRFPGALGESLVLPWALAPTELPPPAAGEVWGDPAMTLAQLRALTGELSSAAWGMPSSEAVAAAAELCRDLRGPAPQAAVARLGELHAVDPAAAERAVRLVETLVASALAGGVAEIPSQVWDLPPERLALVLDGRAATAVPVRSPADRWEPFVYGVVSAQGRSVRGTPVTDGVGAGKVRLVDDPAAAGDVDRAIIVARRPLPALASLLWRAAGLVTVAGSAAAHLFEVATSVGVPAVINVDFGDVFEQGISALSERAMMGAVDGTSGTLWLLEEGNALT